MWFIKTHLGVQYVSFNCILYDMIFYDNKLSDYVSLISEPVHSNSVQFFSKPRISNSADEVVVRPVQRF